MAPKVLNVKDRIRLLEVEVDVREDSAGHTHSYTVIRGIEHLYHGPHRKEAERVFAEAIVEDEDD